MKEESKSSKLKLPGKELKIGNKVRDAVREQLVEVMLTAAIVDGKPDDEYDEESSLRGSELALDIEDAIYERFKDAKDYGDKARSILFNLKNPKNPTLKTRILSG